MKKAIIFTYEGQDFICSPSGPISFGKLEEDYRYFDEELLFDDEYINKNLQYLNENNINHFVIDCEDLNDLRKKVNEIICLKEIIE